jgi:hypothetical protein
MFERRKDAVKLGCMDGTGTGPRRESCIVFTEEREGRSRGFIREDPKEGFGKDIFRKVRRPEFGGV